ncbi:MAG: hypothetical protein AAF334_05825 [Pseudomonadota bacterium]
MSDKNTDQAEKFKETARDLGVDLDEDKLKETLRQIAKPHDKED